MSKLINITMAVLFIVCLLCGVGILHIDTNGVQIATALAVQYDLSPIMLVVAFLGVGAVLMAKTVL